MENVQIRKIPSMFPNYVFLWFFSSRAVPTVESKKSDAGISFWSMPLN